ncbi:glutathione S-transferase [Pseudovirgaria hyperparasitica]|uniref:Glutathione S-transferase n=1 Tax=Pseudovirgaria hyperparasitica TaxID=470096 RepID=A0A6A6W473_9PEZI|nr:glutathione S-transferase [Pseudovirgaria hyperparasitica]KAF2756969.1 glutathione S-transferase [Pseudovirgaria hyperparasitica]
MATNEPKPKITLHWLELSRSHRILWLLEELNIGYELKTYKRGSDRLAPPELKQIHPLGTSPLITIEVPGQEKPVTMVESGEIVEYLCEFYGKHLIPPRYPEGKEGQIGMETEEWLRYRHYIHYAEGTIMPYNIMMLIVSIVSNPPGAPFFIKPIARRIGDGVKNIFLQKKLDTNWAFLEEQVKTAPNGGGYLCGTKLTGADILMVFPLEGGRARTGLTKEKYPALWQYTEKLSNSEGYLRATKKIEEATGEKFVAISA